MTDYEVWTLWMSGINNILVFTTLVIAVILSWYPNSDYRKNKKAKEKAFNVLLNYFNDPQDIRGAIKHFKYESNKEFLSDDEIAAYELLANCRLMRNYHSIGALPHPNPNKRAYDNYLACFVVKMSNDLLKEINEIEELYSDKKKKLKALKDLAKKVLNNY